MQQSAILYKVFITTGVIAFFTISTLGYSDRCSDNNVSGEEGPFMHEGGLFGPLEEQFGLLEEGLFGHEISYFTSCIAGKYCEKEVFNHGPCWFNEQDCPSDHYCPAGTTTPTPCPLGTMTPYTSVSSLSIDISNCISIPAENTIIGWLRTEKSNSEVARLLKWIYNDQEVLKDYALNDPYAHIRTAAVQNLSHEVTLIKVALEDSYAHTRTAAVQNLSHEVTLRKVASDDPYAHTRTAATNRLEALGFSL